jgi:tetratricopeptide (TPR) repeat protein
VTDEDRKALSRRATDNVEAYQLYLQGQQRWSTFQPQGIVSSINYYRAALEKDPTYALAYAGMATAYSTIAVYGPLPAREAGAKALDAARHAVALDDRLADAHVALGVSKLLHEWDWDGARLELERAISLDPTTLGHSPYSYYLYTMNRFDEAIAEARRVVAINPGWPIGVADLLSALYFARHYDEAAQEASRAVALDPSDTYPLWILGQIQTQRGHYRDALAVLERSVKGADGNPKMPAELGYTYAVSGDRDRALAIVRQLKSGPASLNLYLIAEIYAGLGDHDQAFAWLDRAYEARFPFLCDFKITPQFDVLNKDPRYDALLRRMHLPRPLR